MSRSSAAPASADEVVFVRDVRSGRVTRIHPLDRERALRDAAQAVADGAAAWCQDVRVARADGTYTPIRTRTVILRDADGRAAALLGSLRDVMSGNAPGRAGLGDERETLAERSIEEERRRIVEDLVDEVVIDWDVAAGRVRRSGGLRRLLGYSDGEVEASYEWWSARVHPDDRDELSRGIQEYVRGGQGMWEARYRFRRSDGTYVAVRGRGVALLRAADGSATRVVGTLALARGPSAAPRGTVYLTPRQAQVLELVRDGSTSKEIAARLGISEQGVKDHVSSLFERFGAPNRAALVAAADEHDISVERRSSERGR